jgi:hypothetical protein
LCSFNPSCSYFLGVCHIPACNWFSFCSKLATPSSIRPFFCPTVASNFYSSWDKCPSNLWTLPTFSELANLSRYDLISPVATAATAQLNFVPTMRRNQTFGCGELSTPLKTVKPVQRTLVNLYSACI